MFEDTESRKIMNLIESDEMVFDESNSVSSQSELDCDFILIKKGIHYYNSYSRETNLDFFLQKEGYINFGRILLSSIFSKKNQFELTLSNSNSEIKKIIVDTDFHSSPSTPNGYFKDPDKFVYSPSKLSKFPWATENMLPNDYPCFFLTNENDEITDENDWDQRSILYICGTDDAFIRLSKLLFDIGSNENTILEVILESELGIRGVGPGSAEVRFWLPGSAMWPDSNE